MDDNNLYTFLVKRGIRFFQTNISGNIVYWCHPSKTTKSFRTDVRRIVNESSKQQVDLTHWFRAAMKKDGYIPLDEMLAESYHGTIKVTRSRVVDVLEKDDQIDGFGATGIERNDS